MDKTHFKSQGNKQHFKINGIKIKIQTKRNIPKKT